MYDCCEIISRNFDIDTEGFESKFMRFIQFIAQNKSQISIREAFRNSNLKVPVMKYITKLFLRTQDDQSLEQVMSIIETNSPKTWQEFVTDEVNGIIAKLAISTNALEANSEDNRRLSKI